MQLTGKPQIRQAAAALAATLLGAGMVQAQERGKIESSLLLYSETDRVQAVENISGVSWKLNPDRTVSLRLTYDALTGASPNGATPSRAIQTFTRPSGRGRYTIAPGDTPLDDTFHDTRFGADVSLSQVYGRLTTLTLGGHVSSEYDYLSLGGNASITRDFNRKNTTVGLSAAFSRDEISPEGGIPTPFAAMPVSGGTLPREGSSDTKTVIDLVLSLTQIVDRNTVAQFNYSFSRGTGYMTDPFKVLSVVEPEGSENAGDPVEYLYESRPDSRTKHALFGRARRFLMGNVLDLSYRYFWDDWGITSHTVDLFYKQHLGGGHAIEPHLRWYHQSEADFYRAFLVDGAPMPANASADYRLAQFDAYTAGLQYFLPINRQINLTIAGEYYIQRGDASPPDAFGSLKAFDLFPDLDVFMLRVGFSYGL